MRIRASAVAAVVAWAATGRAWKRNGGIPSLRPAPVLALAAAAVACPLGTSAAVVAGVGVPLVLFRRHLRSAVVGRSPEHVLYPVLQFVEEAVCDLGFASVLGGRS